MSPQHPHVLSLTIRRFGGHDARVVEGYFLPDGNLAVGGLEDISMTPFGRRVLAAPQYRMEPAIERIYLGPHPREGMVPDDPVEAELLAWSQAQGTAWFLMMMDGVRVLMPISRKELRQFESED